MKIESVHMSVEDGTMDCIGGVRTEYKTLTFDDKTVFKIKATTDDDNVLITLSGVEMARLEKLLRRVI